MRRILLGLLAAGSFLSCNQASSSGTATSSTANASATNMAVVKFERDVHDFGKIKQGEIVKWDFKFTNTGKSPLIITDAQASCGCTTPTYPKTPIAPGQSGTLHVEFNSAQKMGLQDKQITITANTNPANTRVHLIGEVLNPQTSK